MRIVINHRHVRHLATRCHSSIGGMTDHRLRLVRRWAPVDTRRPALVRARARTQTTQVRLQSLTAQLGRFASQLHAVDQRARMANNGGAISRILTNRTVRLATPFATRPAGLTTNPSLNSLLGLVNTFGTSNRTPGLGALSGGLVPAGSSSWNLGGFSNPAGLAAVANSAYQNYLTQMQQFSSSNLLGVAGLNVSPASSTSSLIAGMIGNIRGSLNANVPGGRSSGGTLGSFASSSFANRFNFGNPFLPPGF